RVPADFSQRARQGNRLQIFAVLESGSPDFGHPFRDGDPAQAMAAFKRIPADYPQRARERDGLQIFTVLESGNSNFRHTFGNHQAPDVRPAAVGEIEDNSRPVRDAEDAVLRETAVALKALAFPPDSGEGRVG